MSRITVSIISGLGAITVVVGPIIVLLVNGILVPMVYQMEFTSPVMPMRSGDTWTQTFYLPDRPIEAFSLRPATYGQNAEGTVTVWIGAAQIPPAASATAFGRELSIDLGKLRDNRIHTFRFPPLQLEPGTIGVIRLLGTDIRKDESFTLWKNTANAYPDGSLIVNEQIQRGDLFFKIYSRFRGLDALRMLKSRWQIGLPGVWTNVLWPIIGLFVLFSGVFLCFWKLFSSRNRSCL